MVDGCDERGTPCFELVLRGQSDSRWAGLFDPDFLQQDAEVSEHVPAAEALLELDAQLVIRGQRLGQREDGDVWLSVPRSDRPARVRSAVVRRGDRVVAATGLRRALLVARGRLEDLDRAPGVGGARTNEDPQLAEDEVPTPTTTGAVTGLPTIRKRLEP